MRCRNRKNAGTPALAPNSDTSTELTAIPCRAPISVYLAAVYAVRQLPCDALDNEPTPDVLAFVPALGRWLTDSARIR